ncbi:MAG: DUF5606 domain-containing protein [Prevotellaceae bacterium]|jgi:hypothetical protein|nr:DUF5606 domain-containing protein [Prevotellaceae bacterium]
MSEETKVDLKKVLSISGYPSLFEFVSQAKSGIIVETISDKKRMSVSTTTKVSSLSDIAIYTDTEELPLQQVLQKIKEKENGEAAISAKSSPDELKKYFAEVLPNYDKDRVYVSHIKKVVEWYNLLQQNNMLDFLEEEEETEDTAGEAAEKNESSDTTE